MGWGTFEAILGFNPVKPDVWNDSPKKIKIDLIYKNAETVGWIFMQNTWQKAVICW